MEQAAKSVSQDKELPRFLRILQQIWKELTLGVGFWGALRPIFAALIAAIPIFFLGQHLIADTEEDLIGHYYKYH